MQRMIEVSHRKRQSEKMGWIQ